MKHFYEFGSFRLDKSERRLLRNGSVVSLTPKAFDTLLFLVENHGHVLEKNELMKALWPGSFVEEGNLTDNVSKLRQALGDDRKSPQYIETVARRGYRFIAEVQEVGNQRPLAVTEIKEEQQAGREVTIREEGEQPPKSIQVRSQPHGQWRLSPAILTICATVVGLLVLSPAGIWNRWQADPASRAIKSIAILPFKPLVDHNRDGILELAMAETLITRLRHVGQLEVKPLSAVRKYTRLDEDAVLAGREQGVDAVLDSTIQRSGERMRVAVRLVSMADGMQLWTRTFDTKFTDIFEVQDSISEKIATSLMGNLTGEEEALLTRRYTDNPEAYELYQRGRYFWNRATTEGDLEKAIEEFNEALKRDPRYALAYVGLADSYGALAVYGYKPMTDSYPRAREAAEKALKIDDTLGEAHTSMGVLFADYYREWARAEQHYRRAIDLSPNPCAGALLLCRVFSRHGAV
jgi:DNA-binding winged helix-turn-helix (wHTH) protein/TolB-like protein